MPPQKRYYSLRTGKNQNAIHYDLPMLRRLLADLYKSYDERCYFQEAFGYNCVDAGIVSGILGSDIEAQMMRLIRKPGLWPIPKYIDGYSEDDAFDVIEFLCDWVSKPLDGIYHSFSLCGWHYHTFDKETGQSEFRDEINNMLCDYGDGSQLSTEGEIQMLPISGLDELMVHPQSTLDPRNVEARVQSAVSKFRQRHSTADDQRDAVRDLADVLEFLKPRLHDVITAQDEKDLFHLANKFGIRHHNDEQKNDYDKDVWLRWIFYYYRATVDAVIRLLERDNKNKEDGVAF